MKNRASELEWQYGDRSLSWKGNSGQVTKAYSEPVQSACLLARSDGVAVVEPYKEVGMRNAVIFNADGSERVRLQVPIEEAIVYAFDSMYYIQGRLTAILATTRGDLAGVVDEETGALSELRLSM